jgi:hypothetical protein
VLLHVRAHTRRVLEEADVAQLVDLVRADESARTTASCIIVRLEAPPRK